MLSRIAPAATLAVLAWGGAAQAQDEGWRFSGSMRLRYEAVDGQVRPGFNSSDSLANLRTTAFAEYRRGTWRAGGEIYDSRAWGGDSKTPIGTNEVDVSEPAQAYVGWSSKPGDPGAANVQVGRFLLNLGSRRLVAADEYRNTTNSYDGARVDVAPAGVRTTLIYTRPVMRLPEGYANVLDNRYRSDRSSAALQLWGGLAAKPKAFGAATLEGSYFHLEERDAPGRPTRDRLLDTFGGRILLDPKPNRWDYEVEALAQTGSISRGLAASDAKQDVRAGFLHAGIGYSWARLWAPHLTALLDVASGDKGGKRYERFDTLYGMRRADYAPAGIYNAIGRANMVTPGVRLEVTPSKTWDAFVALRGLWLQSRSDAFSTTGVRDAAGRSGRYAGAQLDARLRYWLVKDRLRAEVDGVWLAKGEFLKQAPNAPKTGTDERYLSLNVTAQF